MISPFRLPPSAGLAPAAAIGLLIAFAGVSTPTIAQHQQPDQHREQSSGEDGGHEDEERSNRVHLKPEQVEQLGIRVEPLAAGSARSVLERPATVRFDRDRLARVGPRVRAKVENVMVGLGERVESGQPVAAMSSVALGQAKANYLAAQARLQTERAAYQRARSLYEQRIGSEAEMQETRAQYHEADVARVAAREKLRVYGLTPEQIKTVEAGREQPLSYFQLLSPVGGIVQRRDLVVGDTIQPTQTPIHVVHPQRMWVMIDAYERDIPLVNTGQKVELRVRSLPDRTFPGRVDWVSYELEPETRTLPIRAIVENQEGVLRAGMFGAARIFTDAQAENAVAPIDAVQTVGGESVLFVPAEEAGAFKPVPVELGRENGGIVEITSGLSPGRKVVAEGAFDVKSAFTARSRSASHGH